jgi:hypothetical protein
VAEDFAVVSTTSWLKVSRENHTREKALLYQRKSHGTSYPCRKKTDIDRTNLKMCPFYGDYLI